MIIACWSGPRNISTALMRSWSSRADTHVSDEPFYSYYLNKTAKNHPMKDKILKEYETDFNKIVDIHSGNTPKNKKIWYQKHMAQHMIDIEDFSWVKNYKNCFLLRHPKKVINSFIQKNDLNNINELGYPQQLKIIEFLKESGLDFYIVNSDDILKNPREKLTHWCENLNINFDKNMLKWERGPHESDGIWGAHWYDVIYKTNTFKEEKKREDSYNFNDYKLIYDEAMKYYKKMYNMIN